MDNETLEPIEEFARLIEGLREISNRMNLEPIIYAQNGEIGWYRYNVGAYLNKKNKNIFWFSHPNDEEYARNDIAIHTFTDYKQCLQALVQHRTFELVRDVYFAKEFND